MAGCTWDPTFMPAGYTYHGQLYKSPPGPEPQPIGYAYSAQRNEEVLQIWRLTAQDLLDALEEETNIAEAQGVYVETALTPDAFSGAFDHVLREDLRARGYVIDNSPARAVHVRYNIVPLVSMEAVEPADEGKILREYDVQLAILRDGMTLHQTRGIYALPSYGYEAPENEEYDTGLSKLYKEIWP